VRYIAKTEKIIELKKQVRELEAQLDEYKTIAAHFTGKSEKELDFIHPEDLEYALLNAQAELVDDADSTRFAWSKVRNLCETLGFTYDPKGYSPLQQVLVFIKTLARTNSQLKKELEELSAAPKLVRK
jgi:hypothetical protein